MPRKCTVCTHKKHSEIDKALGVTGTPYRQIAKQYNVGYSSLFRHGENCLKVMFAAVIEKKKEKGGIDVLAEFEANLEFARKLRVACESYLADAVDPLKITITPFAHEIPVSYFDHTELTDQHKPTKKTAMLSNLLEAVQSIGKMIQASDFGEDTPADAILGRILSIDKITVKHIDLRSFATDTIKTVDMCIDKFARLGGLYQKEQENRKNLENAVAAVRDYLERFPQVPKEEVLQTFAAGRQVPLEKIKTELGLIG